MSYTQDITDCFASEIGDRGLDRIAFEEYLHKTGPILTSLSARIDDGATPFLSLPAKKDDLPEIAETAEFFRENFDDVIILGTGGSSLGGRTLCALAPHQYPKLYDGPRLHFVDNVDPHTFSLLIAALDWTRTGLIAISKSGSTAETLAQFAVLTDTLRQHLTDDRIKNHVTVVTEPKPSPLTSMAADFGCRILQHDPMIGGRYSALSVTGLLPAAIAGLDVAAIRAGATGVLEALAGGAGSGFAPAEGAAVSVGLERMKGVKTTVLMPYCDRLADFGLWFRQLWAESLGKSGEGTTPIRAVGTVDQHSQLQLYLDGPADKMFTLVLTDTADIGPDLPGDVADIEGLSYLRGRTMGDLLSAAGRATVDTLANNGRPTRILQVPIVDEASVGALMMHFMLETVIAACLIGVDPYDQPAVEEGKILMRQYLVAGS
ncbi:MAG: glucose-6-phosphate isomerase [Alphaproteobacteria bacterium]